MPLIVDDYTRYRYWKGISLQEFQEERPLQANINDGFEGTFGPGKSPFVVRQIILYDGTAHVMLDKLPSRIIKWMTNFSQLLNCKSVELYEESDPKEEWRTLTCYFDVVMRNPIWIATNFVP